MISNLDRVAVDLGLAIDDLPVGSMRMARVDGRRICVVRTAGGVHALDHACPHEGYGLTQGDARRRPADVRVAQLEVPRRRRHVRARRGGRAHPPGHRRRRRVGGRHDQRAARRRGAPAAPGQPAPRHRATTTSGRSRATSSGCCAPTPTRASSIWEAVAHGAPRAEFGWGHSVASATDCLAMVDLYDGDQRALPIVQGIAGIAEVERDRPVNPLPGPGDRSRRRSGPTFRDLVEAEQLAPAQALVRGAIHAGWTADELRPWFTAVVSDHLLSYGHGAIYAQKAFQLLDRLGWERADTVLPHLVPTIVYGTREDTLPYMRPFIKALAGVDLDALAAIDADPTWRDDGRLGEAILGGGDRAAPLRAAVDALARRAPASTGVLDVVVDAVGRAHAALRPGRRVRLPRRLRLARHHPRPDLRQRRRVGTPATCATRTPCAWRCGACSWPTGPGATSGTRRSGRPEPSIWAPPTSSPPARRCSAKRSTTRRRRSSSTPTPSRRRGRPARRRCARDRPARSQATARFLDAPKLERFVAATVTRSIDFLVRPHRALTARAGPSVRRSATFDAPNARMHSNTRIVRIVGSSSAGGVASTS